MKRLYLVVSALFVLSAVLLAISAAESFLLNDNTIPTIQCPDTPLQLSVHDDNEAMLLAGVTASDEKDGDLTDQVIIERIGKSLQGSSTTVTYAVMDSDNHVATKTRPVHYTDYIGPRFTLSQALHYTAGSSITIRDRLHARDSVDGDISKQIKIYSSGLSPNVPGTYPVTFEVTNSLGDTASITMDLVIQEANTDIPRVYLNQYIVYTTLDTAFDPNSYLDYVENGFLSSVNIQTPSGGLVQGTNIVTYTCRGNNNTVGTTQLYVIAE